MVEIAPYTKKTRFARAVRFGMCNNPDCGQIHIDLMDDRQQVFAAATADKRCAREWIQALHHFVGEQ